VGERSLLETCPKIEDRRHGGRAEKTRRDDSSDRERNNPPYDGLVLRGRSFGNDDRKRLGAARGFWKNPSRFAFIASSRVATRLL